MTLAEIAEELRLLAGELKGHDEVDQWIRLDALADELVKEHRFILARSNALGKRVAAAEAERDRLAEVSVRRAEENARLRRGLA